MWIVTFDILKKYLFMIKVKSNKLKPLINIQGI